MRERVILPLVSVNRRIDHESRSAYPCACFPTRGRCAPLHLAPTEIEVVGSDGHIAFEGLTLFSPDGGCEVLKNLTADIPRGTKVLVVGPNEVARTALFQATAGTWPSGVGTLVRPPLDAIFFLPQRPYLPPGTLREILGTGQEQVITEEQITLALRDAGLDSVRARAGGLDSEQNWSDLLSLGEQQLLALTRLILARPAFCLLDRVNTALKPARVRQALPVLTRTPLHTLLSPRTQNHLSYTTRCWRSNPDGNGHGDGPAAVQARREVIMREV